MRSVGGKFTIKLYVDVGSHTDHEPSCWYLIIRIRKRRTPFSPQSLRQVHMIPDALAYTTYRTKAIPGSRPRGPQA
jgi:hypothetical protein